jgi:hypothetical protein
MTVNQYRTLERSIQSNVTDEMVQSGLLEKLENGDVEVRDLDPGLLGFVSFTTSSRIVVSPQLLRRAPADIAYTLAHEFQHTQDFGAWARHRPWNFVSAAWANITQSHGDRWFEQRAIHFGCAATTGTGTRRGTRCSTP